MGFFMTSGCSEHLPRLQDISRASLQLSLFEQLLTAQADALPQPLRILCPEDVTVLEEDLIPMLPGACKGDGS